jgi:lipopolysaccharide transport system ATP-binding protein
MGTIITIENLGKKYTLHHQEQGRYLTLRDTIMENLYSIGQFALNPVTPKRDKLNTEEFWALKGVSMKIKKGDRVGIIGRNGAGKSTLLKILSRITHPTTGYIRIKGRVASLLEVGTGFHPELTGRENIYLNGAVLGMSKAMIKKKFDEIVDFAEVHKFLDTPVKRYSSGMKVRLAFAVAAHLEPEILLVDEVLAVGDAGFQKKCLGKMRDVSRDGRTVLFVSHNLSAIHRLCSRCILLDKGHIVSEGTTYDVVETYMNSVIENKAEKVWQTPGGPDIQKIFVPSRVCIRTGKGNIADHFFCTESFTIEFDYLLQTQIDNLRIGVKIYTAQGEWICLSYDKDDPQSYVNHSTPAGRYRSICHFPPNFLNEGQYAIALYGSTGFGQIWSELDVLTFSTQIGDGVGSHWPANEKRDGVIRPLFQWESYQLDKDHITEHVGFSGD